MKINVDRDEVIEQLNNEMSPSEIIREFYVDDDELATALGNNKSGTDIISLFDVEAEDAIYELGTEQLLDQMMSDDIESVRRYVLAGDSRGTEYDPSKPEDIKKFLNQAHDHGHLKVISDYVGVGEGRPPITQIFDEVMGRSDLHARGNIFHSLRKVCIEHGISMLYDLGGDDD